MEGGNFKKKNRNLGHLQGVETVKRRLAASIKFSIPIITFYVFLFEKTGKDHKVKNHICLI